MPTSNLAYQTIVAEPPDAALIEQIRLGDGGGFARLMQRHNQRMFRVARAIVRDDSEAEDVLQQAYIAAYGHLHQFAGTAAFATWLTRIVINHALQRYRKSRRQPAVDGDALAPDWRSGTSTLPSPEEHVSRVELARMLERAIDGLPEIYRPIVVLREIEELSMREIADCLAISEEAVRVRLHRARLLLREELWRCAGPSLQDVFSIGGARCAGIVARVYAALGL